MLLHFLRGIICLFLITHFAFNLRGAAVIDGCQILPNDNPWNRDISKDPIDSNSVLFISNMTSRTAKFLHADFGTTFGIPYVVVSGTQPKVPLTIVDYADESDPGPYPIPPNAPIEGDGVGDAHVLVIDKDNAVLYELFVAKFLNPGWQCACSAKFDLKSNKLRPEGWTSADAAGLPILPGLVRFDEVATGEITHAVRFTVQKSLKAYVHPATHYASSLTESTYPPMGLRLRLKSTYDISTYTGKSKIILTALKKYGMLLADNGSDWFISGAPDPRWDDNDLNQLKKVPGSAFEVVQRGYATDPIKPSISITSPNDLSYSTNQNLMVTGTGFDPLGIKSLTLNSINASSSDNFNHWSANISLKSGTNDLLIIASDKALPPNISSNTLHILYADQTFDGNKDGIRDLWQIQNFGFDFLSNAQAQASIDVDGDGASNLEEFHSKTNPKDRKSRFAIINQILQLNSAEIQWLGVPNTSYEIDFSSDLKSWFTGSVVTASQLTNTWLDTAISSEVKRFYRVKIRL
jgi:hypothetical protein